MSSPDTTTRKFKIEGSGQMLEALAQAIDLALHAARATPDRTGAGSISRRALTIEVEATNHDPNDLRYAITSIDDAVHHSRMGGNEALHRMRTTSRPTFRRRIPRNSKWRRSNLLRMLPPHRRFLRIHTRSRHIRFLFSHLSVSSPCEETFAELCPFFPSPDGRGSKSLP
jgi:hypothetical protein